MSRLFKEKTPGQKLVNAVETYFEDHADAATGGRSDPEAENAGDSKALLGNASRVDSSTTTCTLPKIGVPAYT